MLSVYARRLASNLIYNLRPLVGDRAPAVAEGIASMIDGLYIRKALGSLRGGVDALRLVENYVESQLQNREPDVP